MNLQEILEHRRAVRYYDASKPIDADRVEACVRLATLAPTSSNMQLWEAYHVTDRAMIDRLVPACMGQAAVKTAQQLVVFVVRPDLWKDHAEKVLSGAVENIRKTYPQEKWEKYAGLHKRIIKRSVLSSIRAAAACGGFAVNWFRVWWAVFARCRVKSPKARC